MRPRIALPIGLLIGLAAGLFAADISSDEYLGIIKFLASPEMRGRATGSPELEKAAAYIRDQFRGMNLKPVSGDSYYQDFDVTTSARLGKKNDLTYATGGDHPETLRFQQDFIPVESFRRGRSFRQRWCSPASASPRPNTITTITLDIDAKGKIVVAVCAMSRRSSTKRAFSKARSTPPTRRFSARRPTPSFMAPRPCLLVNDVGTHSGDADDLEKFGAAEGPDNAGHRVRSGEGQRREQMACA